MIFFIIEIVFQACKPSFIPEQIEKRRLKRKEKLGLKTFSTLDDFLQRHVYHSLPKGTIPNDDFSIIFGK